MVYQSFVGRFRACSRRNASSPPRPWRGRRGRRGALFSGASRACLATGRALGCRGDAPSPRNLAGAGRVWPATAARALARCRPWRCGYTLGERGVLGGPGAQGIGVSGARSRTGLRPPARPPGLPLPLPCALRSRAEERS